MSLSNIDKIANEKGTKIEALWQFVKFIFVCMLATIVQFASLNILYLMPFIKNLFNTPFDWFVFHYGIGAKGLGFFIAFNTANILAQIVGYFVNRKTTFNSSANIAVTFPIFLIVTIGLICLSAWLSPIIQAWLLTKNINNQLAANISSAVCGLVQLVIYFPFEKFLFRRKREENPVGSKETEEK